MRAMVPELILGGFVLALIVVLSTEREAPMMPPKMLTQLEKHGDVRHDDYFWMRERDSAPVLAFLNAENARVESELADIKELREQLVKEMRGRVKEDDISVPVKDGEYYYQVRHQQGMEYPIYVRRKGSLEASEVVMADINELAKGHSYYNSAGVVVSPDHRIAALAADTQGRRFYDLRFKNLETGQFLPDSIPAMTGSVAWAKDSRTLFFSKQHPETLRSYQIYRYELGGGPAELVYEEKDETFYVDVDISKDGEMLLISSSATLANEWRYLDAGNPKGDWQVFLPREDKHEYTLVFGGDRFFILTNWNAKNFRVMEAAITSRDKNDWREVVTHRGDVFIETIDVYKTHLVLEERFNGLTRLTARDRSTGRSKQVEFTDETYVTSLSALPEYDSPVFRYTYESPVRPPSVFDFSFSDHKATLRKERAVPGYDPSKYQAHRLWATAPDGTKVPISLLQAKGRPRHGGPMLLYGYGSYGLSMDPHFNSNVISLVDRGFAYGIAHIRGGSEMGRHWYEEGKLLRKRNTFTDFIACAEHLETEKVTSRDHLYIMGGSAGGLLIGAVINLRPDLFKGAVAAVPFVDVVTTMLDDTIPLTTFEYDEWGNPNDKQYYEYIKSYSPYDNVTTKAYPHVLVTTGYHDSQVQYWEPAKWVAKLRALKSDKNLLLFKTEMSAGHSGASGRFERLKEVALNYAFFLKLEGITK